MLGLGSGSMEKLTDSRRGDRRAKELPGPRQRAIAAGQTLSERTHYDAN